MIATKLRLIVLKLLPSRSRLVPQVRAASGHAMRRLSWKLAFLVLLPLAGCRAAEPENMVGVPISGIDHLAEHLSIQDFWVNGTGGHQAGKGGSEVCCVSLPAKWRPGIKVKVTWTVTNWKRRVYSVYERTVEVEPFDELGPLYVHFLRDGSVRAVSSMYAPWGTGGYYRGPAYDTVLRKRPWSDYKRKPDEPEFPEVGNAMEDSFR